MELYFAYGSNMNSKDLSNWCKSKDLKICIGNPRIAVLFDYSLVFVGSSKHRKGAVASVREVKGEKVYGVLFEIDNESLKNLDCKEGTCYNIYKKIKVNVIVNDWDMIENVITYQHTDIKENEPSEEYLKIILDGANEYKLPNCYINKLEKLLLAVRQKKINEKI